MTTSNRPVILITPATRERRKDVFALVGVLAAVAAVLVAAALIDRRRPEAEVRRAQSTPADLMRPRPTDREVCYPVASGQDPAAAISALELTGYLVDYDAAGTAHDLTIRGGDGEGLNREEVRTVLEHSSIDMHGSGHLSQPVRFADEI